MLAMALALVERWGRTDGWGDDFSDLRKTQGMSKKQEKYREKQNYQSAKETVHVTECSRTPSPILHVNLF